MRDNEQDSEKTKTGRYPWAEWLDGRWHTIQQGVDFDCAISSMRHMLYQKSPHNMRVQIKGDRITFSTRSAITSPPRQSTKYPWELWTNGEPHVIIHGRDFECKPASMTARLYREAADKGVGIEINRSDKIISFTFLNSHSIPDEKWKLWTNGAEHSVPLGQPGGLPDTRLRATKVLAEKSAELDRRLHLSFSVTTQQYLVQNARLSEREKKRNHGSFVPTVRGTPQTTAVFRFEIPYNIGEMSRSLSS